MRAVRECCEYIVIYKCVVVRKPGVLQAVRKRLWRTQAREVGLVAAAVRAARAVEMAAPQLR